MLFCYLITDSGGCFVWTEMMKGHINQSLINIQHYLVNMNGLSRRPPSAFVYICKQSTTLIYVIYWFSSSIFSETPDKINSKYCVFQWQFILYERLLNNIFLLFSPGRTSLLSAKRWSSGNSLWTATTAISSSLAVSWEPCFFYNRPK